MKKFKTCKEILENPVFKELAFELLLENTEIRDDDLHSKEEEVETKINFFIKRKIQQCKYQGV